MIMLLSLCFTACINSSKSSKSMDSFEKGTFGYDLHFLKGKDSILILKNDEGNGQLAVSAKYQGKVFTSTADGLQGQSFGWINYKAFDQEKDPHMNAYGGEDRLWLGPEGGKFSLFFKPGTRMVFENWHTPSAIDTESWNLISADNKRVTLDKEMDLLNYAGTRMKVKVVRDIEVLEKRNIESALGIKLSGEVKYVGFRTSNGIINTGDQEWNKQTGAPCMWSLDMFSPSPKTVIVVPYDERVSGKVATTDYFGEIPKDRISYKNGVLLFKADGRSRGKLGIPPARAKSVAGSYDATNNVLTVTLFDINNEATYLNQEWTPDKDPFTGDAVNAYNDGPLEDGSQMGPFYEIESVSPAAFLKPGGRLDHRHSVFHFTGKKELLDAISQKVFGVSLKEIESAF